MARRPPPPPPFPSSAFLTPSTEICQSLTNRGIMQAYSREGCFKLLAVSGLVVLLAASIEAGSISRNGKFFPLFGFGPAGMNRYYSQPCSAQNLNGTCQGRRDCGQIGGIPAGDCGNGYGVCCVVVKTCGSMTNVNSTYFTNPGYPGTYGGGGRCTITVNRCSGSCQVRLDFLELQLSQPDANGFCRSDFLSVTGGSTGVPRICGVNTGGHVYVDFSVSSAPPGAPPIVISVDTDAGVKFSRSWNIRITQIDCHSISRAPAGCLQYFMDTAGQVSSFNYGVLPNTNNDLTSPGTREMANLNYGVCVRPEAGYCSIEWSQANDDLYSFTLSGDTAGMDETVLGTADAALSGSDCDGDFIVIPDPMQEMSALPTDRFCGNALLPTVSSSKPFTLTVVSNNTEEPPPPQMVDIGNRGFRLNFRQRPCPIF